MRTWSIVALLHEATGEQGESEVDAPYEGCSLRDEGAEAEPRAEERVVGVGVATGGGGVDKEDGADTGEERTEGQAPPLEVGADEPLGAERRGAKPRSAWSPPTVSWLRERLRPRSIQPARR